MKKKTHETSFSDFLFALIPELKTLVSCKTQREIKIIYAYSLGPGGIFSNYILVSSLIFYHCKSVVTLAASQVSLSLCVEAKSVPSSD